MRRRNTVLELTPLLDVILVLMFFILVQSEGRVDAAYEDARETFAIEMESYKEAFEAELAARDVEMVELRQNAEDFEALLLSLEMDTTVILVSLSADTNNVNVRRVVVETGYATTSIPLTWDRLARDNSALELNAAIADGIGACGAATFIVFRYEGTRIFDEDHRLIGMAIHNQRLNNPSVFLVEMNVG